MKHLPRLRAAAALICLFLPPTYSLAHNLDPTFGTGGWVIVGDQQTPGTLALQSDGRSLIGFFGNSGGYVLERLDETGATDPTWGPPCCTEPAPEYVVPVSFQHVVRPGCLQVQGTSRVLHCGIDTGALPAVLAYDELGRIDTTFGGAGTGIAAFSLASLLGSGVSAVPRTLVVGDGVVHVLLEVSGATFGGFPVVAVVARLDGDGVLDTDYGNGGFAIITDRRLGEPRISTYVHMSLAPDGAVFVAGWVPFAGTWLASVVRYRADGFWDSTYGTQGLGVGAQLPGDFPIDALEVSARSGNGAFLAWSPNQDGGAGSFADAWDSPISLVRLDVSGTRDPSFGTVTWDGGPSAGLQGLFEDGDGRLLLATQTLQPQAGAPEDLDPESSTPRLRRYLPSGQVDFCFGTSGEASYTAGALIDQQVGVDNTLPVLARDGSGLVWAFELDDTEALVGRIALPAEDAACLNDADGDSLVDFAEVNVYGTSPGAADTDGDGLSDADEVLVHGSDPLRVDTDGDGLGDGDEIDAGLDPLDGTDCPETLCPEGGVLKILLLRETAGVR